MICRACLHDSKMHSRSGCLAPGEALSDNLFCPCTATPADVVKQDPPAISFARDHLETI